MKDKTILVVGGAGYIGAHMVKRLLSSKYRVITLDNLTTGHREMVPQGRFIQGDLGDEQLLDRIFSENSIDAVMHFAAFSLVGQSVQIPLPYYQNNIAETIALLKQMIHHDVKYFIFSSTAAIYGEPKTTPIDEDHPQQPTNPLSDQWWSVRNLMPFRGFCDSNGNIIALLL
jgi:UDP-glucose 4-epimerase